MISIREIDPQSEAEIEGVATRMRSTLQDVLGEEEGQGMYSMEWLIDRVKWHLNLENEAKIYLATHEEGQVVGHSIVRVDELEGVRCGYFSTIYVAPEAREQGVATALIQQVEAWCREMQFPFVTYNTAVDNDRLIRLYEKLGFEIIQREGEMVKLKKTLG